MRLFKRVNIFQKVDKKSSLCNIRTQFVSYVSPSHTFIFFFFTYQSCCFVTIGNKERIMRLLKRANIFQKVDKKSTLVL